MRASGSLKNYRKRLLNGKFRNQVLDVKVSRDTHNADNATILRGVIRQRTLFTNFSAWRIMRLEITSFNLKNSKIFKLPLPLSRILSTVTRPRGFLSIYGKSQVAKICTSQVMCNTVQEVWRSKNLPMYFTCRNEIKIVVGARSP